MAVFSDDVVRGMLDALEVVIGASPTLIIYDAAQPGNLTDDDVGNVLAELALPADWLAAASGRSKTLSETWSDAAANAAGIPVGFAIKQGGEVKIRGTASSTAGSGEIKFTNTPFLLGQQVNVTSFTLSM